MRRQGAINNQRGFTLVELMITMVTFVLVIAAASQIFTGLLTQFKQQSGMGESNLEGIIGLDILRRDIEHAGYGLPWTVSGVAYSEAIAESGQTPWVDRDFNDGPPDNPTRGSDTGGNSNPPGAIRAGNNLGIVNKDGTGSVSSYSHSDVLIIKAANVGMGTTSAYQKTSQMWTQLNSANLTKDLSGPNESFASTDYVIVITPGGGTTSSSRSLATYSSTSGGVTTTKWCTTFGSPGGTATNCLKTGTASFAPPLATETRIVYGIDGTTELRMPFNRADYYVKVPSSSMPPMPKRCATNTGILYKGMINQGFLTSPQQQAGGMHKEWPLLDCVADMQVVFMLDTNNDGIIDSFLGLNSTDNLMNDLTAQQIRNRLKEVRVYIVAQEGQKDPKYDFSLNGTRQKLSATFVNPSNPDDTRGVDLVNLKSLVGDEYKYYRWKLYTIAVKPNNLK